MTARSRSASTRRALLGGAAVLLAAPALTRSAAGQGTPQITTLRSVAKSWLWGAEDYAQAGGFFTKAGIKVVSSASGRGTNVAALQGGGVDVVLGSLDEPIRSRAGGLAIKTFCTSVNRFASHVMLKKAILEKAGVTEASPVAAKLALLKGLRLGTTGPGAAPDTLARYLAVLGGLNADRDLQLVPTGNGPPQIAAAQQGATDGFIASSPTSDIAVGVAGMAYLFQNVLNPPPSLKEYQYIVASTHEDTLRAKRDALVRYVHGLALALRDMRASPGGFKDWSRSALFADQPAELFEAAFVNNASIYFEDPTPKEALFRLNLEVLNTVNRSIGAAPVPDAVTFASLIDTSIAADAVKL